jgi:hypothetical protein
MECPYCSSEMEKGVIQSQHGISWSKKKHLFLNAEFHDDSVVLSEQSLLKGSAVTAHLCRNCGVVIIDYKNNL